MISDLTHYLIRYHLIPPPGYYLARVKVFWFRGDICGGSGDWQHGFSLPLLLLPSGIEAGLNLLRRAVGRIRYWRWTAPKGAKYQEKHDGRCDHSETATVRLESKLQHDPFFIIGIDTSSGYSGDRPYGISPPWLRLGYVRI